MAGRGDAFYVTLRENTRAHLLIGRPHNKPDKHHLSSREVLSACSDHSPIFLFSSCARRLKPAGHFVPRVLRGLDHCASQNAQIGVWLFCSDYLQMRSIQSRNASAAVLSLYEDVAPA